ncbi:MAG: (2Fe-2S)-binding protein [Maricaulaceae bacterium]
MIVCVCRNLNQAKVLEAIEAGVDRAHAVHRHCGTKADCGCCLDSIKDMIDGAAAALGQPAQ